MSKLSKRILLLVVLLMVNAFTVKIMAPWHDKSNFKWFVYSNLALLAVFEALITNRNKPDDA